MLSFKICSLLSRHKKHEAEGGEAEEHFLHTDVLATHFQQRAGRLMLVRRQNSPDWHVLPQGKGIIGLTEAEVVNVVKGGFVDDVFVFIFVFVVVIIVADDDVCGGNDEDEKLDVVIVLLKSVVEVFKAC